VERYNKPGVRNTRGGMNKEATGSVGDESSPWELPHIAELIDEGQITIGVIRGVGKTVAVANDGETTWLCWHAKKEKPYSSCLPALTWPSLKRKPRIFSPTRSTRDLHRRDIHRNSESVKVHSPDAYRNSGDSDAELHDLKNEHFGAS
jgi:hypothetical protein